jgi:O-antigen/teichoic acid export membrane protein
MSTPRIRRHGVQATRLGVGRAIAAAVSAVWFVVAAHYLSVDDFGKLALLLSLGLMTAIVGDLGLTNLLSEEVAVDHSVARSAARHVVIQRIPLGLIAAALTAIAYAAAGGSWALAAVFSISTLATVVYNTFTAAFRAVGRAEIDAANEVASRVFVLAAGWFLLARGHGLVAAVGVYVAADVASLVVLYVVFRHLTRPSPVVIERARVGLRRGRALGVAGILNTVYMRIDMWLLGLIVSAAAVATYAVSYRIFEALLLPALTLASLSVVQCAGLTGERLRARLVQLASTAVAVTVPIAIGVLVAAPFIISTLFGSRYTAATTPLRILAVCSILTAPIFATTFPLALRSSRVAWALGVALALNVAGNIATIPALGPAGSAWTTLACDAVLLAWILRQIARCADYRDAGSESHDLPITTRVQPFQNPTP